MDMMSQMEEEQRLKEEAELSDFEETIALDETYFTNRNLSGRGRDVHPSGKQRKFAQDAIAELKFNSSGSRRKSISNESVYDEGEDHSIIELNLTNKPRIFIHKGLINRHEPDKLLRKVAKRYMHIFNDIILVSNKKDGAEQYEVLQLFWVKDVRLKYCSYLVEHERYSFELIISKNRGRQKFSVLFSCEDESSWKQWIDEIENTLLAYHRQTEMVKQIGWFHEIIQGNFFSAAYLGDAGVLRKHINFFSERFRTLIPVEMNSCFDMPNTIDALDGSGMGALHWAVLKGHEICVRILLDRGADVDIMQKGCNSPLLLAAAGGQETLARLLIDRGASVYTRNHKGHDVVFMSVLFGHATKGLPWLIQLFNSKGLDLNRVDSQGATPLHLCAERNLSRPIRMLVDSGADVNAKHGRTQLTPLQIACSHAYPDVETIRSFLDKGAYPNWKDLQGRTALQLIVWKYNPNGHGSSPNPFRSSVIFSPQGSRVDVQQMLMSPSGEAQDSSENTSRDSFRMSSAMRESERWRPMEDTIVQVGDWAVRCLPVVLELCKKGARYNSKDIEHLRPSFRAAISEAHEKWEEIKAPTNFIEFITVREQSGEELRLHKVHWNKDKTSTSCQLCDDNFKLTNRRHHCRACGALVCDGCSVKRLTLTIANIASETQSGGGGKLTPTGGKGKDSKKSGKDANDDGPGANGEERVCDGCFNRLVHEATQPTLDTFRIRQLKQCAMDLISSVDELIDSLDNMPTANSNRSGGNNGAYFQEMLDLANQLDSVNLGGSNSKGPGSISGSSMTSGYSNVSTPTTVSNVTSATTPTTASNRSSKRFSLSRLGSRLTASTPTTPPPPSMTTPPPPPSSASSTSTSNAAYLANQQQLIEALRTREQRLYRVQDIVMKFLDASENYHGVSKRIIEKKIANSRLWGNQS